MMAVYNVIVALDERCGTPHISVCMTGQDDSVFSSVIIDSERSIQESVSLKGSVTPSLAGFSFEEDVAEGACRRRFKKFNVELKGTNLADIFEAWKSYKYSERFDMCRHNCADMVEWFMKTILPECYRDDFDSGCHYAVCGICLPAWLQPCTLPDAVFERVAAPEVMEVLKFEAGEKHEWTDNPFQRIAKSSPKDSSPTTPTPEE